jgi:hypothetical protein
LENILNKFLLTFFLTLFSISCYAAEDEWYPFNIPWRESPENILNLEKSVLDAPAGKYGFVKSKNGHFYFENGKRIKFWGINLTGEINFPTHETAGILAKYLAKFGINIVRLHHMDSNYAPTGLFDKSNGDTLTLSAEQMDKLDYFIAELKKHGIYIDLNLHVGRKFTEKDGIIDAKKLTYNSKTLTIFDDKFIELEKDFAKKIFTHFNPYTKTYYYNEPAIALTEISNENSLFPYWVSGAVFGKSKEDDRNLSDYYLKELDNIWIDFLKRKYKTTENLKKAWSKDSTNPGKNLVKNNGFENNTKDNWVEEIHKNVKAKFFIDDTDKAEGKYSIGAEIDSTQDGYNIQFKQPGIKLEKGKNYTIEFKIKSQTPGEISVSFGKETSPWTNYGLSIPLSTVREWTSFKSSFYANETTDENTRLSFVLGKISGKVWIDDISLCETGLEGLANEESIENKNIKRTEWKERFSYTDNRYSDNAEFYYYLENKFYTGMIGYIKNLGVKVPVSTTNEYYGMPSLLTQKEGDYVDVHGYWDHPSFPEKRFDAKNFKQQNKSFVSSYRNNPIISFIMMSLKNKPLTISEWNHVFPNDYEYEESLILTSYSLLQDWDGLFAYTLGHHYKDFDDPYIKGWFDFINNSTKMALMPACSMIFLNGYLNSAKKTINISYSKNDIFEKYRTTIRNNDFNLSSALPNQIAYIYKIKKDNLNAEKTSSPENVLNKTELDKIVNEKIYTSDTGEIGWNTQKEDEEYVFINAPKVQGAIGFLKDKTLDFKNMKMKLDKNCAAILVSMDNKNIDVSGKLLLTIAAKQKNTDQEKDEKNGLRNWGKPPVLLETVKGNIELILKNGNYEVYSLDEKGNRKNKLETGFSKNVLKFNIENQKTPWYEIVTK